MIISNMKGSRVDNKCKW